MNSRPFVVRNIDVLPCVLLPPGSRMRVRATKDCGEQRVMHVRKHPLQVDA